MGVSLSMCACGCMSVCMGACMGACIYDYRWVCMFAHMCTCAYLYIFICAHVEEVVGMNVYVCGILWACVHVCISVCVCTWLYVCACVSLCAVGSWAVELGAFPLLLTDGPANEALSATCLLAVPLPPRALFPPSSPAATPVTASLLPGFPS